MPVAAAAFLVLASGSHPVAAQQQHLYRTLLIRAAPGELASVIELLGSRMSAWERKSAVGPFWMRHSQGDQWDLMLLFHMGRGFDEYFSEEARRARMQVDVTLAEDEVAFEQRLLPKVAWREELFVWGPPPEQVAARFDGAGFFHVEIFQALPGKRGELVRQREMENEYLRGVDRPTNLIFTRVAGAPWDSYTIGFYRDIKHFAESADIPLDAEDRAARNAGFESVYAISPYLRSLIAYHHDTLAVAIP